MHPLCQFTLLHYLFLTDSMSKQPDTNHFPEFIKISLANCRFLPRKLSCVCYSEAHLTAIHSTSGLKDCQSIICFNVFCTGFSFPEVIFDWCVNILLNRRLKFKKSSSKSDIMSSSAGNSSADDNHYIRRQKNNEAARMSRMKRKNLEIEVEKVKKELEKTYVELRKQISQMPHRVLW